MAVMMKWCSATFAAMMFPGCVAVWAAAAALLADVLVVSVAGAAAVLDAVTVWNAVVELAAAAGLLAAVTAWNAVVEFAAASAASVAVVAVALLWGVSVALLLSWCMRLSECLLKVLL